ncbi:MAG: HlyD family efflux transporter periplasmic adaptor subunit [Rhizobacter sp.]
MSAAATSVGALQPPAAAPKAAPWPVLREEITLHPGPTDASGAPTWSLQDPSRHQFFRIDWLSFEILSRWHLGNAQAIADDIERQTTQAAEAGHVEAVVRFLGDNQLIQCDSANGTAMLLQRHEAKQSGAATWLLHHYLFFRVPLLKPDRLLGQLLPWVAPFYSRGFLYLTLLALVTGVWMVTRRWGEFAGTLVDMLTPAGFLQYGAMLIAVKALHELGHAFTAKRLGCRVPTMGVAFLVMYPMAYTDVTEAWKLTRRRDRLAIGSAGIAVELALAAWATLAWALLPEGAARNLCFVLATITWITTLVVNVSPIMRFDGYFLLSDLLDLPNLHARSFALARWKLREWLFALGEEPPEHFSPARERGLVLFAYFVWAYRLTVFIGIAVMVYHYFFKALGVFLFIVEIAWFVVMPVWSEVKAWRERWGSVRKSRRTLWTLSALALVLLIGLVPWRTQVEAQGLLRPRHFPLHAAGAGQLQSLDIAHGRAVRRDDALFTLASPELALHLKTAELKLARTQWQVANTGFDDGLRSRQSVLQEERRGAEAELLAVRDELARHAPRAPFDGVVIDVPPELQPGTWVARNERLATVVDPRDWRVEVYLPENEVERIKLGDSGHFFPEASGRGVVKLTVTGIDRDATRVLPEPQLAQGHGGELAVREKRGQLVPEQAVYRVTLQAEVKAGAERLQHLRGHAVIDGEARSALGGVFRSAAAVVVREAGW